MDFSPDLLLVCGHCIAFSEVHDFFNIVHQAVKHPLDADLDMPPQGEPIHSLAAFEESFNPSKLKWVPPSKPSSSQINNTLVNKDSISLSI